MLLMLSISKAVRLREEQRRSLGDWIEIAEHDRLGLRSAKHGPVMFAVQNDEMRLQLNSLVPPWVRSRPRCGMWVRRIITSRDGQDVHWADSSSIEKEILEVVENISIVCF